MTEFSPQPRRMIRFGAFELDLHAAELRKAGVRLSLPPQSLEVLKLLLERPGDLVTRDELRQRLWPNGTFVDFDHSLNAIVNRLRETLGDSADRPRFIETAPRRGYRFVGAVESASAAVPVPVESSPRARTRRAWRGCSADSRHVGIGRVRPAGERLSGASHGAFFARGDADCLVTRRPVHRRGTGSPCVRHNAPGDLLDTPARRRTPCTDATGTPRLRFSACVLSGWPADGARVL
jgi:DNA-binding winged helix-turn-helix (wHTH) protein